jgi:hypothetical protein
VYVYYQQSYEAREQIEKRSRQRRAKRIIQRASRARRQRRRRRAYLGAALQRLMAGSGTFTGSGVGVEDAVSGSIATCPGTWVPGHVVVRHEIASPAGLGYGVKKPVTV